MQRLPPPCRCCLIRGLQQNGGPSRLTASRAFSALPARQPQATPFFTPPYRPSPPSLYDRKGKERAADARKGDEEDPELEVSDREWEMRVAKAMLHLRETLPHFFRPDECGLELCSPEIFSRNVVLKLPVPFPVKISSLAGYSMAHALTRNGLSALHSDLSSSLDRMTFSPSPQAATAPAAAFFTKRIPAHRHKQVRVLLSIRGTPRLPPHNEALWHTSSLYTFSPYSGLIACHEVEKIRPLPGEGVGEWFMSRVLGWASRHAFEGGGGGIPIPSRATAVSDASCARAQLTDKRGLAG